MSRETTYRFRNWVVVTPDVVTFAVIGGAAKAAPAWMVVGIVAVNCTVHLPSELLKKVQFAVNVLVTVAVEPVSAEAEDAVAAPRPTSATPPASPVTPSAPNVRRIPRDELRPEVVRVMKMSPPLRAA